MTTLNVELTKKICIAVAQFLAGSKSPAIGLHTVLVNRHEGKPTTIRDLCVALANPELVEKTKGKVKFESVTEIRNRLGVSIGSADKATLVQQLAGHVVRIAEAIGIEAAGRGRNAIEIDGLAEFLSGTTEEMIAKRVAAIEAEPTVEVDFAWLES